MIELIKSEFTIEDLRMYNKLLIEEVDEAMESLENAETLNNFLEEFSDIIIIVHSLLIMTNGLQPGRLYAVYAAKIASNMSKFSSKEEDQQIWLADRIAVGNLVGGQVLHCDQGYYVVDETGKIRKGCNFMHYTEFLKDLHS